MLDDGLRAIDPEPRSRPRSLRQACVEAGLDQDGQRCLYRPLKGLCRSELRWLVKTAGEEMYRS